MKHILQEAYSTTRKLTGVDPSKPGNIRKVLYNDDAFNVYVDGLSESLEDTKSKDGFRTLCENTRINLLENSMFQINPYESLALPVLRVFYPKLVAKEAVSVIPMDKPETIKPFLKASFEKHGSPTQYAAPSITEDISNGPGINTVTSGAIVVPSQSLDLLATIGLTSKDLHLERDFEITLVTDGANPTVVSIVPAVEGHFSSAVDLGAGGTDVISGYVDYLNGTISVSSATGVVTSVEFKVTTSLEENMVNPKIKLEVDKIRLYAKDREISANWSIHMEQDMKALFDISMQAEIVSVLGQQIALDIDREIITALIAANGLNAANHVENFNRTPPGGYTWGTKQWHENILAPLNKLSAQIYTDTNIDQANTILANPVDVAILEDINTFRYSGTSSENGELGFREATVNGGKWKILTSSIVPQGQMLTIYKPVEEIKCVYIWAPYVPVVLSPYPLGATPSLTILSRNANALVRSEGIGVLTVGP